MTNQDLLDKQLLVLESLLETHRNDLIIAEAVKILEIDPDNELAIFALLLAYNNTQQYDLLYQTCQVALSKDPNNPQYYYFLYLYYLFLGEENYLHAKDAIEKALLLDPENAKMHRELGEIFLINWQPDEAVKSLRKAVELNNDHSEYRSRLAVALVRCGNIDEAITTAGRALSEDPNSHGVLNSVGMVYLLSGELDKAEQFFRDALSRFPTYNYYQKQLDTVLREKELKKQKTSRGEIYQPMYKRQKERNRFF